MLKFYFYVFVLPEKFCMSKVYNLMDYMHIQIGMCFNREGLHFRFLSRYVLNESQSRQNSSSAQGSSSNSGGGSGIPQPPPGMSFYAAKRVIGDNPWTPEQLEQV